MPASTTSSSTAAGNGAISTVPHLSVAERVAHGKAARAEVPRSSHAVYEPPRRRAGPGQTARTPGKDARARARPDPLRAHARLAVYVLSGSRPDHGQRPGDDATLRAYGAVLRRRTPVQLRRVRLARADAGVRRQRLRRDPPRALGVGCQAPGREHADRGPLQRFLRQGPGQDRAGHRRRLPHSDGGLRRDEGPRRLVRPPRYRKRAAGIRSAVQAQAGQAHREDPRQGAHEGQHDGLLETHAHG